MNEPAILWEQLAIGNGIRRVHFVPR